MPTPPVIRFSQFNISGVSPSGSRHLKNHSAYIKELGVGAGQYLNFGSINITQGKQSSSTKAVVAMVDNMKDATEAVFNLRLWISNDSDFAAGTYYFNGFPSGIWISNCNLTDASGKFIPTMLPSGQNLWRQDGGLEITASGQDIQTTQYIYLSVTADSDIPVGTYGGNAGGFVFRITFDYR